MKLRKILTAVVLVLLAIVLVACVVFFWHYPHYVNQKSARDIHPDGEGVRMMSYNLRCLSPLDLGQRSWYNRADLILDDIEAQAPGIIGFQEATRWQYDYLVDTLPGYDSVITYRDESIIAEGCPIFYNTSLYTLVDKGSFWLSETPEVMSKDWGAAHYRICSYVILTDNQTGTDFVVFNTHLDHVSDEARIKGIEVVLDKIAQFGGLPAVIMGDFNAVEGSETYNAVTQHFLDACRVMDNGTDAFTYQGWGEELYPRRIDFFMISKTGFEVTDYQVLSPIHDGVYASDHCPIVLDVTLQ